MSGVTALEPSNRARRRIWKGPGWTLFPADQRRHEAGQP